MCQAAAADARAAGVDVVVDAPTLAIVDGDAGFLRRMVDELLHTAGHGGRIGLNLQPEGPTAVATVTRNRRQDPPAAPGCRGAREPHSASPSSARSCRPTAATWPSTTAPTPRPPSPSGSPPAAGRTDGSIQGPQGPSARRHTLGGNRAPATNYAQARRTVRAIERAHGLVLASGTTEEVAAAVPPGRPLSQQIRGCDPEEVVAGQRAVVRDQWHR